MSRVREEARVVGTRAGTVAGLRATGGVITSAGVVLAATFAALAVIPILFVAQLAFLVAFGVLLDTLLVRTLLVPGLIIDIGRRSWWPSRLSRQRDSCAGRVRARFWGGSCGVPGLTGIAVVAGMPVGPVRPGGRAPADHPMLSPGLARPAADGPLMP
ncbi:hypothetical protein GCM10022220_63810 [Actinocatenispora rupis]|uniref:Membrane transport protein MMPL domain-containing protein n=1 Tax=Actinocatenispora rupis TaxID=519421 RepID=A0A8J3JB16_9ACTN|nr:hypothetical protein Aru02nite_36220 [Actinocatenispora rupis]